MVTGRVHEDVAVDVNHDETACEDVHRPALTPAPSRAPADASFAGLDHTQAENTQAQAENTQSVVLSELVRSLFDLGKSSRFTMFIGIVIVGLTFYQTAGLWTIGAVAAVQLTAQLAFDWLRHRYTERPQDHDTIQWARRYSALCVVSGATWGLGAVLWLPGSDIFHHMFYWLVVSVLCMSSVIIRSVHPPAFWAYSTAVFLPTAAVMATNGNPLILSSLVLAGLTWTALGAWTRQLNLMHRRTIELSLEKTDLVNRLTASFEAAETQRQAAEKAGEEAKIANKAKAQFLSVMAHEVKIPIDTVTRTSEMLAETSLDDAQKNHLQTISDAGALLRHMFASMVELSRIEASMIELKHRPFEPAALCRSMVGLAQVEAMSRRLTLELDIAAGTPPQIVGDPDRVRQVLVHLVANALKFTETGGVIVRVAPLERPGEAPALRISVLDTGVGIDAAKAARLTDAYAHQSNLSSSDGPSDSGLGLAICSQLVRQMGGDIGVDSTPKSGSCFWFTLPCMPAVAAQERGQDGGRQQTAPGDQLIDHRSLKDLEKRIGPAIFGHLVGGLKKMLALDHAIKIAHRDGNGPALAAHVVELKALADEMGLVSLTLAASDISKAVDEGQDDMSGAFDQVAALRAVLSTTQSALEALYPRLSA